MYRNVIVHFVDEKETKVAGSQLVLAVTAMCFQAILKSVVSIPLLGFVKVDLFGFTYMV